LIQRFDIRDWGLCAPILEYRKEGLEIQKKKRRVGGKTLNAPLFFGGGIAQRFLFYVYLIFDEIFLYVTF
jgi:hypothetical protein